VDWTALVASEKRSPEDTHYRIRRPFGPFSQLVAHRRHANRSYPSTSRAHLPRTYLTRSTASPSRWSMEWHGSPAANRLQYAAIWTSAHKAAYMWQNNRDTDLLYRFKMDVVKMFGNTWLWLWRNQHSKHTKTSYRAAPLNRTCFRQVSNADEKILSDAICRDDS